MLTFLAICARKRLTPESYEDEASGWLEMGASGKLWISRVTLRPRTRFAAEFEITAAQLAELHHHAHEECFIANSVKTRVNVEPRA